MTETLNIDHHMHILLQKALAKGRNEPEVARLLGISLLTMQRWKQRWGYLYNTETKAYERKN